MGCGCFSNMATIGNKEYIGHALLMPKHIGISIYNNYYKEKVIDYAINDTVKESYPLVAIVNIKDSLAEVALYYPLENKEQYGWIEIKHLGIHLAFDSESLNVMSQPDLCSEVSFKIENPQWGDYYPVIDAYNGWLYIQNIYNPKEFGWLAPSNQCNNPYTTCC